MQPERRNVVGRPAEPTPPRNVVRESRIPPETKAMYHIILINRVQKKKANPQRNVVGRRA